MSFGRLQRRDRTRPMGEINMTPLIDVMLVLLVIFIITAPLMRSSLQLDLPSSAAARPSGAAAQVTVAVQADGTLYWGDARVSAAELGQRVQQTARRNPATEVQLRADQAVPYGRITELIGLVQQGGLSRIGFVTETGDGADAAAATGDAAHDTAAPTAVPDLSR